MSDPPSRLSGDPTLIDSVRIQPRVIFSICLRRSSCAGSGLATCTSDAPAAKTASRPSISSSAVSHRRSTARGRRRSNPVRRRNHRRRRGPRPPSGRRARARAALGDDLVAVHPHRGRVVGDADRQVGHGLAERVQRQHRDLAGSDGGVGLVQPVGGAQRDVGRRGLPARPRRRSTRSRTAPPRSASGRAAAPRPGWPGRRRARREAGWPSWPPSWPASPSTARCARRWRRRSR